MTSLLADAPDHSAKLEWFESRIRPVLVEYCYSCHNSAGTTEGELAIDFREGFRKGGRGGVVFVPGKPEESRLIAILKHEVDGLEMPEGGLKLSAEIIADFEKWIADGAIDPRDEPPAADEIAMGTGWQATMERRKRWWSFQPISAPQLDENDGHPIDLIVDAKLKDLGLAPAPRAETNVLIRRLFLNLIGLPPSPAQFQRWSDEYLAAGNESQAVTEALVDELLANVQFGPRWARHWMDWIRYAESHGSEGDPPIDNAWLYRDYLIRAFNNDVPYDQLVREHIAGDLLDDPRVNESLGVNESVIGASHWRMVFHGYSPTDAHDEKVRFIDDQVNTFSKAFLGLTVSCARCHDHKFDPIGQDDYYALFGILSACRPARNVIDLPSLQYRNVEELTELKPMIRKAISDDWSASLQTLPSRFGELASRALAGQANRGPLDTLLRSLGKVADGESFAAGWDQWTTRHAAADDESMIVRRWRLSEQSVFNEWYRAGVGLREQVSGAGEFAVAPEGDRALVGVYPAGVYSHSLSSKHPARLTSPDVPVDDADDVWIRALGDGGSRARYVIHDYPRGGQVFPSRDLNPEFQWHRLEELSYWDGEILHVELACGKDIPLAVRNHDRSWFGVSEVRLLRKGAPAPQNRVEFARLLMTDADPKPQSMRELLQVFARVLGSAVDAWRSDSATDGQASLIDAAIRAGLLPNELSSLASAAPLIRQYRSLESEVIVPRRVPGLDETSGRKQPLYVRGDHHQPAENIPRRFLAAIDALPYKTDGSGRVQLAEDVLRDDNPLSRRVIVNRIWHHLFGRGIVATPNNFGRLGSTPTHPQLLDWLADQLVKEHWSIKRMIRLIVTSQTWQRSSQASEQSRETDPNNLYLSRANVRRLEAEAIRDSLLQACGQLDDSLGGNSVGGDEPRRSIFVQVSRNRLDPLLRAFDFPEPTSSTGRRDMTNVPAQSLMMMNSPQVVGYADSLGALVVADSELQDDEQRISQMFIRLFTRAPKTSELQQSATYLESLIPPYERLPIDRMLLQRRRYSDLAHALLTLKELLYVR